MAQKITTGAYDGPRNETISGEPDDSSTPLDADVTAARLGKQLQGKPGQFAEDQANPDAPGIPGAGVIICRRCAGTGMIDGRTCPECRGTGKTPIGGG